MTAPTLEETNARFDRAARVIGDMQKSVEMLREAIFGNPAPNVEPLTLELAALYSDYKGLPEQISEQMSKFTEYSAAVAEFDRDIEMLEANALLYVGAATGDADKPLYKTVKAREAAVKNELGSDSYYRKTIKKRAEAAMSAAQAKIKVGELEGRQKEYGRRNRALIAQLELAAAKINRNGGGK